MDWFVVFLRSCSGASNFAAVDRVECIHAATFAPAHCDRQRADVAATSRGSVANRGRLCRSLVSLEVSRRWALERHKQSTWPSSQWRHARPIQLQHLRVAVQCCLQRVRSPLAKRRTQLLLLVGSASRKCACVAAQRFRLQLYHWASLVRTRVPFKFLSRALTAKAGAWAD